MQNDASLLAQGVTEQNFSQLSPTLQESIRAATKPGTASFVPSTTVTEGINPAYSSPSNYPSSTLDAPIQETSKVSEEELKNDPQYQAIESLKTQLEAQTKAQIDAIKNKYSNLRKQQEDINKRAEASRLATQLVTGTARYAQGVATGETEATMSYGLEKIRELNDEEDNAIANANVAQFNGNLKIMEQEVEKAESIRKEKQERANELYKQLSEQYNKTKEAKKIQDRDIAIGNLLSKGISNPSEILNELGKQGITASSKEVKESIESLSSTGLKEIGDIMKELAQNNAPLKIREDVSNATSIAEAYEKAGDWLETGTGIVGEYLKYKRDAIKANNPYISFNEFQNVDANRKAKATAATSTGLDNATLTKVESIAKGFDSHKIVQNYNEVQNKFGSIQGIIDLGVGGPGDLALVYDFMKALDPASVVRETEYAVAAKSGNIFSSWAAKFNGYLKEEGGFLPENVKQSFKKIMKVKLDTVGGQYNNLKNEYARRINKITGRKDGNEYLTDYSGGISSTSDSLNNQAIESKKKIDDWIDQNSNDPLIVSITNLYEEGKTDSDIYEWLKLRGKLN